MTLALLALKARRPPSARYVVWPRMDQKTCAKAVSAAGLELVPVPLSLQARLRGRVKGQSSLRLSCALRWGLLSPQRPAGFPKF